MRRSGIFLGFVSGRGGSMPGRCAGRLVGDAHIRMFYWISWIRLGMMGRLVPRRGRWRLCRFSGNGAPGTRERGAMLCLRAGGPAGTAGGRQRRSRLISLGDSTFFLTVNFSTQGRAPRRMPGEGPGAPRRPFLLPPPHTRAGGGGCAGRPDRASTASARGRFVRPPPPCRAFKGCASAMLMGSGHPAPPYPTSSCRLFGSIGKRKANHCSWPCGRVAIVPKA